MSKNIHIACALFFYASLLTVYGAQKDTIIISDGSPGPYILSKYFMDTTSLKVAFADTLTDIQLPPYMFIGRANAIMFSRPVDSGSKIRISYKTILYGLPKTYSLYEKSYITASDTLKHIIDTISKTGNSSFGDENLTLSGYKSIGVSVNNMGSINLEQALDVNLSGEIAPHTTLSGHLSDQGSSLEGSTREVSDLDMVYVSLKNPRYNALVGDQYEKWAVKGMLSGEKKIKGIEAGITLPGLSVKGFGALSSGKFAVQTITGISGLQGPYKLTGDGESGYIIPVEGTIKITVGGNEYAEGSDRDYTVDYDAGTITFTSRKLIKSDDIIKAEYEYRIYDYQRIFSGTELSAYTRDSSLTLQSNLWYEFDDKNKPLDLTLSSDDISRLSAAGDSADIYYRGRLIDSKDVAWESAQFPLYRLDSSGNFVFSPYDPQNPADNQGFYYVSFKTVDAGEGDYIEDSTKMETYPAFGTIYKYVGSGRGDATLPLIPLPQATVTGEALVKARLPWMSAKIDVAGMNQDLNLFSDRQDNDNSGAALDASAIIGAKKIDRKALWLTGAYTHVTKDMKKEVSSAYNRNKEWDDTTSITKSGLRQTWENCLGAAVAPNTYIEAGYGQYLHDKNLVTEKITGTAGAIPLKNIKLDYSGNFFRHHSDDGINTTRRGNGSMVYTSRNGTASVTYKDEWRVFTSNKQEGMAGAGTDIQVSPLALKESFFYSRYRSGHGGFFSAIDTGYSVLWEQEIGKSFLPNWHVDLTSHYYLQDIYWKSLTSTVLVTAQNDLSFPKKGVTTKQSYQVTIEQAASYVQVPVYVGTGLGDHVWDSTDSQYVPAQNGNYIIEEQEVYGSTSEDRVRKVQLNASWTYRPSGKKISGILADLDWAGNLSVDEQLNMGRNLGKISWLPGYTSLFNDRSQKDSLVSYADIYYKQNLEWNPSKLKGYRGSLSLQPFYKKIRSYWETGMENSIGITHSIRKITIGIDGNMVNADRKSLSSSVETYNVYDRHAQLTEKYNFYRAFSSYLKETAGFAEKKSDDEDNNGWYYRISPGLSWQPSNKGSAELCYTYSAVNIPGTLEYRMAQGFSSGVSHVVELTSQLKFGTHFTTDISVKSQFGAGVSSKGGLHTVSMQMKAML
jgi:hypothetical protein